MFNYILLRLPTIPQEGRMSSHVHRVEEPFRLTATARPKRASADTMKKRSGIGQARGAVQQILGTNHAIAPWALCPTFMIKRTPKSGSKKNQKKSK
jgi:hypothetical protein